MSVTAVVLLVVGILALQLLIWIPVIRMVRRKTARLRVELAQELAAAADRVVLAPVPVLYRGATRGSGLPFAKGNSVAALTDRRLVVRRLVGAGFEVPTADVVAVRDDKWFLRASVNRPVVILKLRNDAELGLIVDDHTAWMTALRAHTGADARA